MTTRIAACILVAALTPAAGYGQTSSDAGGERLSLASAIKIAVDNNRQLASARLDIE